MAKDKDAHRPMFETGADAEPTDKTANETKPKEKRSQLGPVDAIRLSDWLRGQWTPEDLRAVTPEELAKAAADALGRKVTANNVKTIAEHLRLEIGEKVSDNAKKLGAKLAILAREHNETKTKVERLTAQVERLAALVKEAIPE